MTETVVSEPRKAARLDSWPPYWAMALLVLLGITGMLYVGFAVVRLNDARRAVGEAWRIVERDRLLLAGHEDVVRHARLLSDSVAVLEERYGSQQALMQTAHDSLNNLRARHTQLAARYATIQESHRSVEAETRTLRDAGATLEQENRSKRATLAGLAEEISRKQDARETINAQFSEMERSRVEFDRLINAFGATITSGQSRLNGLSHNLEVLGSDVTGQASRLERSLQDLSGVLQSMDGLRAAMETLERRQKQVIEGYEAASQDAVESGRRTKVATTQAEQLFGDLESAADRLMPRARKAEDDLRTLDARLESIGRNLSALEPTVTELLELRSVLARSDRDSLERSAGALHREIDAARQAVREAERLATIEIEERQR